VPLLGFSGAQQAWLPINEYSGLGKAFDFYGIAPCPLQHPPTHPPTRSHTCTPTRTTTLHSGTHTPTRTL
jgi:hypothetical protein